MAVEAASAERAFEGDGAGEQHVVFEMDVFVQIRFELGQRLVAEPVGPARVRRRRVTLAPEPDARHVITGFAVVFLHHANRIEDRSEWTRR
jgi:hypothetical protein